MYEGKSIQDPLSVLAYRRMPAPSTAPLPDQMPFLQDMAELPEALGLKKLALVTPWANCSDQGVQEIAQPPAVNYELFALPDAMRVAAQKELFSNPLPFIAIYTPTRPSLVEIEEALEETPYELHSLQAVYNQGDATLQPVPDWLTWISLRDLGDAEIGSVDQVAQQFGGVPVAAFSVPYQRFREPPETGVVESMKYHMRNAMSGSLVRGTYTPTRQVPVSGAVSEAPTARDIEYGYLALTLFGAGILGVLVAGAVLPEKRSR